MAIVLTEKFAEKIDERYYPTSVSAYGTNQNYDWDGAQTIKVTSIGTTAMGDYNRSTGYGTVASADELSNTVQTLTLSKDRFFRAKLDKMDENESKIKSGEVLGRELREVTIPEIEAYRFNVMCANILANTANGTEITATDSPYADFLEANTYLDDLDSFDGLLTTYKENMTSRQEALEEEKEKAIEYLDSKYASLAQQLADYNTIINQFEAEFSGLSMMIEEATSS